MKKIAILGSTGSIGTQTLEVVRYNKDIQVTALAAGTQIVMLEQQVREFSPKLVCVFDEERANELAVRISDCSTKVVSGMEGLIACATEPEAEIVVTAIVGMIGIRPTIAAIRAGKDIALANKETLVTAGHIIMPLVKEYGVKLLPVDSEHSAIFQALNGENMSVYSSIRNNMDETPGNRGRKSEQFEKGTKYPDAKSIHKILLTASGGPFRTWKKEDFGKIRVEDALKHPNWAMGKKITIDSATMVNKGLEVMEAKWLFDVDVDQVQVVVQPQSIVHSMVEFVDGSVIAQLGTPDMKLPIQYALYYPGRRFLPGCRLDFWEIGSITFEKPDMEKFRGLALAYEVMRMGGSAPTVYNAANERAVAKFLNREISFTGITDIIEAAVEAHTRKQDPDVEEILFIEQETYDFVEAYVQKQNR